MSGRFCCRACLPLLTLPFFETAFGIAFPYVLLAMLALTLLEELFRLVRALRRLPQQLSLSSIQDAIDTLDDGLLFAAEDGSLLLSNRTMGELSSSLCRQALSNANEFWGSLEGIVSSDFLTKVASKDSFLFRFAGGNTWTFHREQLLLSGRPLTQIVALNVTESDGSSGRSPHGKRNLAGLPCSFSRWKRPLNG